MTVGQRIKAAREKAGMTQAELAGECGLATITVQQYERDKRQPRFEQLQQIADALHVDMAELLPGTARGGDMSTESANNRILTIAKQRGLSIKELAGKANIPYTTLYSVIKRNSSLKYETLRRIADALHVDMAELLPGAAYGSVDNGSRREGGSIKTGKEDLSMTGKEDFRMNNHINLTVRAFPVTVMDERTGETRADRIVLTREQLQAAQLVGESSTELIYRCFNRRGFKVLEIRKPVKREVVVSIYANEKSIYVGGAAALEETEAAEE